MSHLTRGAWIEIARKDSFKSNPKSRTSHEVRGLKFQNPSAPAGTKRRTSHEVRGLK